jgi:hypothetical protein
MALDDLTGPDGRETGEARVEATELVPAVVLFSRVAVVMMDFVRL